MLSARYGLAAHTGLHQERGYLQALSRVRAYELTDNRLKLSDEKGLLQIDFVVGDEK